MMFVLFGVGCSAGETIKSTWQKFELHDFAVDGRKCLVVLPKEAGAERRWIWRTEFFGHEPQGDLALLEKGWHVVYMDVQNMYGAPKALDHMDKFYEHLMREYKLSARTVLEGFSRGGLFAFNWAARHPERVAAIYGDAPVCDFKSWPGGKGKGKGSAGDWKRLLDVYGFTEEQALGYKLNPIDNLEPLAKGKVALLLVCGDADKVVPYEENSKLIEERYKALGGEVKVILKPGVDHHPHSLKDPGAIVEFLVGHK